MKICLTHFSSPWSRSRGGGNLAVHHLAGALCRKGCEVHVIFSKFPAETHAPEVPYRLHWTRRFNIATINLDIFSFARTLNRLARRERFDVIHGNGEEALLFSRICERYGAKLFFTNHAPSIPSTGIWRGLRRPVLFLKRLNTYLSRAAAQRAVRIVTFSRFSKKLVLDGLGLNWQNRVEVIPPGIDPSWFEVERTSQAGPELIFWGRVEEEKGIPELLTALKEVTRQVPGARLTLVGDGHRLEEYKRLAETLGVQDRVQFPGWLKAAEIQKRVSNVRVGVFPSRIESFGLAVAEAMAAGLPVITTRTGAIPEIVEDQVTGCLVPPGDPAALAEAILDALGEDPKFFRMAEKGRESVRGKFSWDLAAERLLELYQCGTEPRVP